MPTHLNIRWDPYDHEIMTRTVQGNVDTAFHGCVILRPGRQAHLSRELFDRALHFIAEVWRDNKYQLPDIRDAELAVAVILCRSGLISHDVDQDVDAIGWLLERWKA